MSYRVRLQLSFGDAPLTPGATVGPFDDARALLAVVEGMLRGFTETGELDRPPRESVAVITVTKVEG
jgi:hypothetical protein